jgi:hypothetical protein
VLPLVLPLVVTGPVSPPPVGVGSLVAVEPGLVVTAVLAPVLAPVLVPVPDSLPGVVSPAPPA